MTRAARDPLRRPRPTCEDCGAEVLFARTLPGRALQPLDPERRDRDDAAATVAVRRDGTGGHYARSLARRDAYPLEPHEHRHVPHAATCTRRRAGASTTTSTTTNPGATR